MSLSHLNNTHSILPDNQSVQRIKPHCCNLHIFAQVPSVSAYRALELVEMLNVSNQPPDPLWAPRALLNTCIFLWHFTPCHGEGWASRLLPLLGGEGVYLLQGKWGLSAAFRVVSLQVSGGGSTFGTGQKEDVACLTELPLWQGDRRWRHQPSLPQSYTVFSMQLYHP